MFAAFSLLNIGALAFVAFVPFLVFAYRKRDKRNVHTVSSLLCFRNLKIADLPKAKIKLPLRFFVELLALLLILFAAALPFQEKSDKLALIVIDNSLSMSTKTANSDRWSEALKKLKDWIEQDKKSDSYTIFTTTPTATQTGPSALSKSAAINQLANLKVASAEDKLEAVIDQLSSANSFERLVVVTDKELNASDSKIEKIVVNEPAANLFFRRAAISEKEDSNRRIIGAQIENSSGKRADFKLSLFGQRLEKNGGQEIELFSADFKLDANNTKEIELPLPQNLSGLNLFRLQISSAADSITADNTAWISLESKQLSSLLLVTSKKTNDGLGLSKIPGNEIKTISPAQFAAMSAEEIERHRGLILHRTPLSRAFHLPTLVVLPTTKDKLFKRAASIKKLEVSSWIEYHPLVTYLQVPLLSGSHAVALSLQPWQQPIINSPEGPIVVAGESEGVKFLGIGIEIFPFEGLKTPALSVLTLNSLSWLTGSSATKGSVLVGDAIDVKSFNAESVITPDKEDVALVNKESFVAAESGAYLFYTKQGAENVVAVNPFFLSESLSNSPQVAAIRISSNKKIEDSESSRPIWPLLVVIAGLLFLVEYLLRVKEKKISLGVALQ